MIKYNLAKWLATLLGVGYMKQAPGTWGSLVAVFLASLIMPLGSWVMGTAVVVGFIAGWWATRQVIRPLKQKDPGFVVIDELAGQWMTFVMWMLLSQHNNLSWFGLLLGWGLFRLFDIIKVWPASFFDHRRGAFYVMMDDIVAGLYAGVCLYFIMFIGG